MFGYGANSVAGDRAALGISSDLWMIEFLGSGVDMATESVEAETWTPYQRFIRLLYEAYGANQVVDYFDLTSNPSSRARYASLEEEALKANKALHAFCAASGPGRDLRGITG